MLETANLHIVESLGSASYSCTVNNARWKSSNDAQVRNTLKRLSKYLRHIFFVELHITICTIKQTRQILWKILSPYIGRDRVS